MSGAKSFSRYSGYWLDLFYAFKDHPDKEIKVECNTEEDAMKLRLEWYKARQAFLRDEGARAEFGPYLDSREVKLHGKVVTFVHKDTNWVSEALKGSLEKLKQQEQPNEG